MDGNVSIRADGDLRRSRLGFQCAAGFDDGHCDCADGSNLHFHLIGNGIFVGQTGMGRVLGLGRAHDFDVDPDVLVHRIHLFAIID